MSQLEFTGERFIPSSEGDIALEHLHRYLYARPLTASKRVLDIACGEGYGSAILAESASSVIGVDIAAEVVSYAAARYPGGNLEFRVGSVSEIPVPDASVDVVVSFETLEHHDQHQEMMLEIKRVLTRDGVLVISSPDRYQYSDVPGFRNSFHVHELYASEFDALLRAHFSHVRVCGQRVVHGSLIAGNVTQGPFVSHHLSAGSYRESTGVPNALYLIAVASESAVDELPGGVFDVTPNESELARSWAALVDANEARFASELRACAAAHQEERDRWEAEFHNINAAHAQELHNINAAHGQELHNINAAHAQEFHNINAAHAQEFHNINAAYAQEIFALNAAHNAKRLAERAEIERDAQRLAEALAECRTRLSEVEHSRSWALTRPYRVAGRVARGEWKALGDSLKSASLRTLAHLRRTAPLPSLARARLADFFYTRWGSQFQGTEHYEAWRARRPGPTPAAPIIGIDSAPPVLQFALAFPEVAEPLVSIIIPTYGNLATTRACLQSLHRTLPRVPIEILVAEDASPDIEINALRDVVGLRYFRNPENLGFLRSCNSAAERACGEFICFLNNDTEVTPDWLERLLEVFRDHADAGIVGSKLVYPDGRLQEAGGIIWADASAWNFGRYGDPHAAAFNYVKEVDYVSGAALMIRRELFAALGGFDQRYVPAYCEDSDLAFAVRSRGLKVYYQPASEVIHCEGVSHGTDAAGGLKIHQVVNRFQLLQKWRAVLHQEHFANGTNLFVARDRSAARPCVLVIDHHVPQPDRDAGSRTMSTFLRALVALGCNIKFWPSNNCYDQAYCPPLQQLGIEVLYGCEYAGNLGHWLAAAEGRVGRVLLSRPDVAAAHLPDLLACEHRPRIVYYGHDLHHARWDRQYEIDGRPETLASANAWRKMESEAWRAVDLVLYPSEEEARRVRELLPGVSAEKITPYTYPHLARFRNRRAQPGETILFVAGFAHSPNVDAAIWLATEILPLIRKTNPGVRLCLVGSHPSPDVLALASDAVEVTGYLTDPDLEARYVSARVAVVPLRFGAGVKNKVLEALSYGVPLVTTSTGVQGLDDIGDIVAACDSAEMFAAAVITLLTDHVLWETCSHRGIDYVDARFSEASVMQCLASALDLPYQRNRSQ